MKNKNTKYKNKAGIYMITSRSSNRFYIGSAVNLLYRKNRHFCDLRKNRHQNKHLQRIFDKYGENDLTWSVIEIVEDTEKLIEREQHYIDRLNPEINISKTAGNCAGLERDLEYRLGCKNRKSLTGTHFEKDRNKWKAQIGIKGKHYVLGHFNTAEEAHAKYLEAYNNYKNNDELPKPVPRKHKYYRYCNTLKKWQVRMTIDGIRKSFGYFETEQEAIDKVKELKESLI